MQKLRLQVEILTTETGKDTLLKTKAWLRKPFVNNRQTDQEKVLIHNSENTFDSADEQGLEHVLAATAYILHASLALHGEQFGN